MNRTKVVKAISMHRARKAGKLPPHSCMPDSEIDYMAHAIEALEEIASEDNVDYLRKILAGMEIQKFNTEPLGKLIGMLQSIQVPKEVVYAYPVTMHRHFMHYHDDWLRGCIGTGTNPGSSALLPLKDSKDDFGCEWRAFAGSKELVQYLRDNNVPIKVIE